MPTPLAPEEKISDKRPRQKKLTVKEQKRREEISDCTTMAISVITRSSYLIQLDQIRTIFILDDIVRSRIDTIIIEEIEEILEDITVLSTCEIFNLVDSEELGKLLDELGDLNVNKARQYGEQAWDIFSEVITDYIVETWTY